MNNLARKIQRNEVHETVGVVIRAEGGAFFVRTDLGDVDARRAVSCVVEPELRDEVLVSVLGDGRAYVLAILERDTGARARMVFEGDVDVELRKGRFGVKAAQGVSLTSGKELDLTAGELNIRALAGKVVLQKLSYVGTLLRSEVESIKTFAATLDSVVERFSLKAKRSYRDVEEVDQARAKEMHYTAKENLFLNGGNAIVSAEELVKVDGEQIHLG